MRLNITALLVSSATIIGCSDNNNSTESSAVEIVEFKEAVNLSEFKETEFLPTIEHRIDHKKNSVYSVSLLYAWNEVRKQIEEPIEIPKEHKDLYLLDNSNTYKGTLKENEYYADGTVDGELITARAEFHLALPFKHPLNSFTNKLEFKGQKVQSFGVYGTDESKLLKAVNILYYKNDDNFILNLQPNDTNHSIIVFKSQSRFKTISAIQQEIERLKIIGKEEKLSEKSSWKYYYNPDDIVVIPKINFNIKTNYESMEGNSFSANTKGYQILKVFQQTAFRLDENGAKVKSQAEIEYAMEEEELPKPKKMILDKPFLILLKRTESNNPYFGLWVATSELMIPE